MKLLSVSTNLMRLHFTTNFRTSGKIQGAGIRKGEDKSGEDKKERIKDG
jgi:hypothetical protein